MFILNVVQAKEIEYLLELPEDRLNSAFDYLSYLHGKQYPLDDYDYQLAKEADEDTDTETISFDEVLIKCGLTYDDLQNKI